MRLVSWESGSATVLLLLYGLYQSENATEAKDDSSADLQVAATEEFLQKVFIPEATSAGASVLASILQAEAEGSAGVGQAICDFVNKDKPSALVVMKQNKSALARFFLGSVTKHCATHSHCPVVIVPS
jgi:nucleotide-binding universal stress UspA family protein